MRSKGKRQTRVIRLIFLLTLVFMIQHQSKLLKKIEFIRGSSHHILDHHQSSDIPFKRNDAEESNKSNSGLKSRDTTISFGRVQNVAQTGVATLASNKKHPCALLFFGLIKEFSNLALPAIQEHILQHNPTCDIFLHTYNITVTRISRRNQEHEPYQVRIEEAYQLTNHVALDTEWTFEHEHSKFLRRTRRLYHREWGACCKSHDNMIKQWHSVKRVWDLMTEHEQNLIQERQATASNEKNYYYEQIGLFRSDVFYMSPIDIFDSHNATLPNFASYKGYNDRLFIGQRQYAQVWADRFSFAHTFENQYMISSITRGKKRGYHSETFLYHLLNHNKVPVEKKNICVWRIRAGARLSVEDCTRDADWFTKEDIPKYLPEGYTVQMVEDVTKLRNGKNKTSRSLWGFPPDSNLDTSSLT